jgi:hypothetical protein
MATVATVMAGAGVYGLDVRGLGDVSRYADAPAPGSPVLAVRQRVGPAPAGAESQVSKDRAVIALIEDGLLDISRDPLAASFVTSRPLSSDELLHPWLVPAAATANAWLGRRVLHGGLVSKKDRALAIIGDKEAGKSTLLAWLALEAGLTVLCDDLVVLDGDTVFRGPQCIDLRPPSLAYLPAAAGATLVRDGTRLRLPLPRPPATATFVGFVVLEWGATTAIHAVPPAQHLPNILPHAFTEGIPAGVAGVLGFARYRMWRLTRPRDGNSLADSALLIADMLG